MYINKTPDPNPKHNFDLLRSTGNNDLTVPQIRADPKLNITVQNVVLTTLLAALALFKKFCL